ncbi:MAG: energy-coupling factor transporter transmembrane protein EcfT [Candidatus Goldbacteria bacterium]|nr:energy-coupling factor transporter transmembrane protein EcfT [Candidatus Goldiibacteriota bacterium]
MSVFFWTDKRTFFHELDPRIKILFVMFLFFMIFIINNIFEMIIISVLLFIFFILSDSLLSLKKILFLFLLIGFMTFVLWFFFYKSKSDEKIYFYKNFYYYKGALYYAALFSLRFLNMLLAGLLFLSITSYEDFAYGLLLFGLPYPVAFTVLLSFKLVDSFTTTAFTIVEAQKARGNDISKGSIIKRILSYIPLVVPLILNGVKKAQNLIVALETRGFSPHNKINIKDKYKIRKNDIIFILFIIILITLFNSKILFFKK